MEHILSVHRQIDRRGWARGPWDDEPDRYEWEHNGTPCLALRGQFGAWCGYAAVRKDSALYGRHYHDVPADVHGGLTYAQPCRGDVCHPAQEQVWWFGFDCSHAFDVSPGLEAIIVHFSPDHAPLGTYKDLEYVKQETERLAEQLNHGR